MLAAYAQDNVNSDAKSDKEELQDMSDHLAVYTQMGAGDTNKGLNIKIAQSYDTGSATTMAMNVLEIKVFFGDTVGWDSDDVKDDQVDSFRLRNFKVDMTNGRGAQIDIINSYDETPYADETGSLSYSIIQALPPMSVFQFYPLAGLGMDFSQNALQDDGTRNSGYSVRGFFGLIGVYAKSILPIKFG